MIFSFNIQLLKQENIQSKTYFLEHPTIAVKNFKVVYLKKHDFILTMSDTTFNNSCYYSISVYLVWVEWRIGCLNLKKCQDFLKIMVFKFQEMARLFEDLNN